MAILQSTNVQGALCVNGVAVGGGRDFKFCCFTASSTFTPSQDLVDGNGFLAADVVGAGGGGGAFAHWVRTSNYPNRIFNAGFSCFAGVGGFIQEPYLPITATTQIDVAVGTGGNSGSYIYPQSVADSTAPNAAQISSSTGGGLAGGASCFGSSYVAYGGQGGVGVRHVCNFNPATSNLCYDAGGTTNAAALSYEGGGNGVNDYDSGCAYTDNGLHGVNPDVTGRITAQCLQNGGSEAGGKVGVSGIKCGQGHKSVGVAIPGKLQITSQGTAVCVSCTGCTPTFCDCRHCSGSTPGTPGGAFCTCQRFSDNQQSYKFLMKQDFGKGANGIVVINWAE